MPELNQKIQKYINRSRISIYQLAKNTNLDRTMIQKMIKGSKYPGVKFFYKFCDALMLNRDEREELIRLFRIEKEGFSHYQTHVEISRLLGMLQNVTEEFDYSRNVPVSAPDLPVRDGTSVEIIGTQNIRLFVYMMLKEQISQQSTRHIYLDVCDWSDQILKQLYHLKKIFESDVEIHQHAMLSYQNNVSESNFENIYTMQKILPPLFMLGEHYHIRYSYVNNAREGHMYMPFQHYLLGTDRLFLFNDEETRGISITDSVLIEAFQKEVRDIEEKSRPLVRYSDTLKDAAEICRNVMNNNRLAASYGMTPCISMFASLLSHTGPADEAAKALYLGMAEKLSEATEDPDYIQIYGTAGIHRFLETGMTPHTFDLDYPAIPKERRIHLVREYVEFLKQSSSSYLLKKNDAAGNVYPGFEIKLFAPNRILLSQNGTNVTRGMVLLEENSMYENLLDYFQSMIEYEEVYKPKEGAEQFRKIIDNYISKL